MSSYTLSDPERTTILHLLSRGERQALDAGDHPFVAQIHAAREALEAPTDELAPWALTQALGRITKQARILLETIEDSEVADERERYRDVFASAGRLRSELPPAEVLA